MKLIKNRHQFGSDLLNLFSDVTHSSEKL